MRVAALLLLLAGCAPAPDPGPGRDPEIRRLVAALDAPALARLEEIGEEAVPALAVVVTEDRDAARRVAAARVLGRLHRGKGVVYARMAWARAVREAPPALAAALLELAPDFADEEGETLHLLNAAIATQADVPAALVRVAGRMGRDESLEALTRLVGRTAGRDPCPERAEALRYVGRAARRGNREAVEFLLSCVQAGRKGLEAEAGLELSLLAGRVTPANWRSWWLDHAGKSRAEWILEALALGGSLDVSTREGLEAVLRAAQEAADPEPEFHLLGRLLGRDFGYVSPRDEFGEGAPSTAKETLRAWWAENGPRLRWDAATGAWIP